MKLIKPDKKYADSYYRAVEGYKENNIRLYEFFDMPFEKIVKYTDDMEKGENLPKGWVPATCLWFVDEQEFLGEISIRHELTENLEKLGGHVGYGVRYDKWAGDWNGNASAGNFLYSGKFALEKNPAYL